MHLTKEEQILFRHCTDMIQQAYQRSIPVFSQFMSLHEMDLAYQAMEQYYGCSCQEGVQYQRFGGYDDAERCVLCFLPQGSAREVTSEDFPLRCICIEPRNKRFCNPLSHRDYLGTIMGLGITRDQIGDILVEREESGCCRAYVFCKEDKSSLLLTLDRVRHTAVSCRETVFSDTGWKPEWKDISGNVSSFRLDAVLAVALKLSRSRVLELIQNGSVFLNGRCCTENAKKLEEGAVISIRKYGKFIFYQVHTQSKKGRYHITIKQYL
ncbi:MAG: YlmH/Sll1252 family protein [Clostridiaceae bacterium]|nr:YlmH/Sll1252 family protein [Clostridiaceae bacterium]